MNRNILKKYAPEARRVFIRAVTDRASYYGLTKKKTEPVTVEGDVVIISGRPFPKKVAEQRKRLEEKVNRLGFEQVMEAVAYTWFNRLVAIRYMELHGYLDHGYRVLSHPEGDVTPEIVEHAEHLDLPGLDKQKVISLKLDGTKESELYRMLLIAQCNALHKAMPFLFEHIGDETELLLPDNLLHSDSLIRTLVKEIPEVDWQEVEIIGWLYQFYISEKKDQVIGKVVKSEDIPAATQLFTPNWIVKYLVQNSLGRQWMATYPISPLKGQMEYYIEPAEQTPEVQEQLKAITPESLTPEELTLLDPACGSGHILVEAYDLLKAIYQERGYRAKDIPRLILEKNLFGLEIDDRAAQLAAFALMMKARADDRHIFAEPVQLHVLAIQESKGLDAREITEALNQPIFKGEAPPPESLFEELDDDKAPLFSKKAMGVKGTISQSDVAYLIKIFEDGKTFGSLIRVPNDLVDTLTTISRRVEDVITNGGMFERAEAALLSPLIAQSRVLCSTFDVVAANPPYMGSKKGMNTALKEFAGKKYKNSKGDLFAMFIERGLELSRPNTGINSMVIMEAWMFLSTFDNFREQLLDSCTVTSFVHMPYEGRGPTTMGIAFGTIALVGLNCMIDEYRADVSCARYTDIDKNGVPFTFPVDNQRRGTTIPSHYRKVPGSPFAYWASETMRDAFSLHPPLSDAADPQVGLQTSDNPRFLRYWHEVDFETIGFFCSSNQEALESGCKWFPHHKGGDYRRWYGNRELIVNWKDDGKEIKEYVASQYPYLDGNIDYVVKDRGYFFRPGVTWSHSTSGTFSCRYVPLGSVSNVEGPTVFADDATLTLLAGMLNSRVSASLLGLLNATLHFLVGTMRLLPFPKERIDKRRNEVEAIIKEAISLARSDWDRAETSWDFRSFLFEQERSTKLATEYDNWCRSRTADVAQMKVLEEKNNAFFADIYGLQDELSPDVPDEQITLYRPNVAEDMKRLVSYAVGCMMGRYSLDKAGLIYAHSGGDGFDSSQYQTFPADADGIIPITDFEWFEDDAANRLEDFVATAWPKEHLEENLKFVAESLGPNKGERPRETIRRYLSTGFFKHHLQLYKKRPIYWLFSSGKQRAFQCVVYLHRYNEGTLSRMRTEYVIPLSGQMASRIDQLEGDIAAASSTAHRKKLEKERQTLIKQRDELQTFDEQLRHYADQRIKLELDDGVKVNYGKFGNLLAEVKAITGQTLGDELP